MAWCLATQFTHVFAVFFNTKSGLSHTLAQAALLTLL